MKKVVLGKLKKTVAVFLMAVIGMSTFSGCNERAYAEPELIDPMVVSKIFRHPEVRDLMDVQYYEGVVVPHDYPAFYKNRTQLSSINVKIGDYVEKGDVIAYGAVESYGNTSSDWKDMINNETTIKGLMTNISDDEIELQSISRKVASENGDNTLIESADKQIALLGEDKRYNSELSEYMIGRYRASRDEEVKKEEEAVLVASHSGYVTFVKDISTDDVAKAYENVAVISDMDDLFIEATGASVKNYDCADYDEKYTYVDGKKIPVKEVKYADDIKSLSEVTDKELPVRYEASAELKCGDNMLVVLKKKKAENVMCVGSSAVVIEGLSRYVYVRKKAGSDDIEKRSVEVGYRNENYTEIKYGLTEEDEVYYPLNQFYPVNYKEIEVGTGNISVGAMTKFILGKNSNVKGYYTEYAGQLQEIYVKQDDEVKKGDLLFTYKTENTAAKLKEINESIKNLKANHASTIESYTEMKAELASGNSSDYSSDASGEYATATDSHYNDDKDAINGRIIDYRIQIENTNYSYSLKKLEAQYQQLAEDNDGSGLISVYAESDGIVKNVDRDAIPGKVYEDRKYIVSISEEGVNETLIQMREYKTSGPGEQQEKEETTGDLKAAPIGKEINVKIGEREYTGRAIGVNGNKDNYDAYYNDKPVFTYCTPGREYKDQFYADIDGNVDYDEALRDKGSVEVTFLLKDYKGIPVLDKGLIYTSYLSDKPQNYVWKEVNGELVMQYVTVINLGDERTGDVAVIDGLEVGDKIVREVSAAVEED
ncbi:MAG: biotin/lipoyl-binding protein [Eubacterium sp.]|nr:biotin/lipoyl-binding protein [Eubacterium sp.]